MINPILFTNMSKISTNVHHSRKSALFLLSESLCHISLGKAISIQSFHSKKTAFPPHPDRNGHLLQANTGISSRCAFPELRRSEICSRVLLHKNRFAQRVRRNQCAHFVHVHFFACKMQKEMLFYFWSMGRMSICLGRVFSMYAETTCTPHGD